MNCRAPVLALCLGLSAVLGFALWACLAVPASNLLSPAVAAEAEAPRAGPPPLVVDPDAPLLLEEPGEMPPAPAAGRVADNQACYVCHANYEDEELAQWHAKADVGCMKCHGASLAHRNDENNTTPPDVMFPPGAIDKNCAECHDMHDAPAAKVIARWQERCPEKTNVKEIVCTDCHGRHRLDFRTVRWDRKTGELISSHVIPPTEVLRESPTRTPEAGDP
jgi:hypothetical protein